MENKYYSYKSIYSTTLSYIFFVFQDENYKIDLSRISPYNKRKKHLVIHTSSHMENASMQRIIKVNFLLLMSISILKFNCFSSQ